MTRTLTRRRVLQTGAAATAALGMPFVHGAHAAGGLAFGVWDHWVPGASEQLKKMCQDWAAKEKVDLTFDLITSNGDKDLLTLMAEGQAKAGHDIMGVRMWYAAAQAENFEPADDIVKVQIAELGKPSTGAEYLGTVKGSWVAVPTCYGSSSLPPCARIDRFKEYVGLDVQKMYPGPGVPRDQQLVDAWTWDYFLTAAEKCFKAGYPFGLGMSTCTDAINMAGAVFAAYGAHLVDAEGSVTANSDGVKQALEWFQRLAKFLPESTYAWDNASNNKFLISGQGSLIMNPPSAWSVATRDAPKVAEQLWTFSSPKGPKGRFDPAGYYYWGTWKFAKNKSAAKALLAHLSTRASQDKLATAARGFDIPPFASEMDFKVWEEEGPPKGTNYNFPPRGDVIPNITGYPAPLKIGTQIYAQATIMKMIAMCTQGKKPIKDAIAFAESEVEGFMRS
jgi:hypothetical protein